MSDDELTRLSDKLSVVGLETDTKIADRAKYVSTFQAEYLEQALSILQTLDWAAVDVYAVPPAKGENDNPMLLIQPPGPALWGGEQSGIVVTPLTHDGREKKMVETDLIEDEE